MLKINFKFLCKKHVLTESIRGVKKKLFMIIMRKGRRHNYFTMKFMLSVKEDRVK